MSRNPNGVLHTRSMLALALGAWAIAAAVPAPVAPEAHAPADFKIVIGFFGVRNEAITTAELVVRGGIAYVFSSQAREEILIFDPAAAQLELIDLGRKIQAEIAL